MYQAFRRNFLFGALLVLAMSLASNFALAACGLAYSATTLVKNTGKKGDKQLINPWGLVYGPSAPFWLSDQGSGLSTLYDGNGVKQSLVVSIPPASGTGLWSPPPVVVKNAPPHLT